MEFGIKLTPYLARNKYFGYVNAVTSTGYVPSEGGGTQRGNYVEYATFNDGVYGINAGMNIASGITASDSLLVGATETDSGTTAGSIYYNDSTIYPNYIATKLLKAKGAHIQNLELTGQFMFTGTFQPDSISTDNISSETIENSDTITTAWMNVGSNTVLVPSASVKNGINVTYNQTEGLHQSGTTYGTLDSSMTVSNSGDTRTDSSGNSVHDSAEAIVTTAYLKNIGTEAIDVSALFTASGSMQGCLFRWMNANLYAARDWGDGYTSYRKVILTEIGYGGTSGTETQALLIAIGEHLDYTTSIIQSTGGVMDEGTITKAQ